MITKEILEQLEAQNMMYFMLGSIISADNNDTEEEIQKNLNTIKEFENALKETDFPEEKKKEYFDYLEKGTAILERDLKEAQEMSLSFEEYSGWKLEKAYEEQE